VRKGEDAFTGAIQAKRGLSKEALDQVYTPIENDINSEPPEEIAVSIVAELIQMREESIS
jgi:xanthine dehydrogenase accessory factor